MKLGAQLYNFREEIEKDFEGTFAKLAQIGFQGVEIAAFKEQLSPDEMVSMFKSLNLECAGFMAGADRLSNKDDVVYEYAKKLNSPAVTCSYWGCDFAKDWRSVIDLFNKIGEAAAANGLVFTYHNHWWEWDLADGVPALLRILDGTDPEKVCIEADVCWINRGGAITPVDFIKRYANRIRQIHMKDILVADDIATTAPLGTGIIDLKGSYKAALSTKADWLIYEQDNCKDVYACAAQSLEYLKQLTINN